MLNTWGLNEQNLNGSPSAGSFDWESSAPIERARVYFLDVGSLRLPISSAQSTMRLTGQSYLQVIVPGGDEFIDDLAALVDQQMLLRAGYEYVDGSFSPLEVIALAPFEQLRDDEGTRSRTLTLDGYGANPAAGVAARQLKNVQYRNISASGIRRVRCDIDLFLKPGQTAIDEDDVQFNVGIIQYFINSQSEFMEVIQDG